MFLCLLCATVLALALGLRAKHNELGAATAPVLQFQTTGATEMQTLVTKWTSARGEESVITPQFTDESDDAHVARHNAKVALAQESNPPI
jgi:hypothetical protein